MEEEEQTHMATKEEEETGEEGGRSHWATEEEGKEGGEEKPEPAQTIREYESVEQQVAAASRHLHRLASLPNN